MNINCVRFEVKRARWVPTPGEIFDDIDQAGQERLRARPEGCFLQLLGAGREIAVFQKKQAVFAQDDAAGAVFYILEGKVRHTVVSMFGKEANLDILSEEDFLGYCGLAGEPFHGAPQPQSRTASL